VKKYIVILALLSLSTAAFAQIDPDPDMMGIYFDTGATTVCAGFQPYTWNDAFVCLTNASSAAGISGFEFSVDINPPLAMSPLYILPGGTLNVVMAPNFICGLASPLPWSPSMVLLTIQFFPFDPLPIYFTLGPSVPSDFFPPYPGYADGADPGLIKSCGYSAGGPVVCAIANGGPDCGVVPTDKYSWGSVKSLFR
jgi:hypothetical protein